MICIHCLKDAVEYGPLSYCKQCKVWYEDEGEEINGVYLHCTTKGPDPEKCNDFVQSLIMRPVEIQEGEEIPIADTTMDNIRRADEICAACENKNFVME